MINIVLIGAIICWIVQLVIWGLLAKALRGNNASMVSSSPEESPVSVIICAKNEVENLSKNLPIILDQDYPEFEVLIVDDNSVDRTAEFLAQLQERYSNLRVIAAKKPTQLKGKRYPLKVGIERARHEYLLLTDADCCPSSNQWIRKMMHSRGSDKEIVLGLGPYIVESGNIVNTFARYENLYTAYLYGGSALLGIPYMGVGRNILYRRSALELSILEEQKLSGDDDLMVNRISKSGNTGVTMDSKALCYSEAPATVRAFWRQKTRHVGSSLEYNWKHILWLNVINGSQSLFHLFSIILIFHFPAVVIVMNGLRWILMQWACGVMNEISGTKGLRKAIPLLDYLLSLYFLVLAPAVFWKSRKW